MYVKDKVVFVHDMKAFGGMEVCLHSFLTSALVESLYQWEMSQCMQWIGKQVGSRASLHDWGEEIYLLTMLEIKPWCPGHPVCNLVTTLGCTVELAHRENSTVQLVWFYMELLVHGHLHLYIFTTCYCVMNTCFLSDLTNGVFGCFKHTSPWSVIINSKCH